MNSSTISSSHPQAAEHQALDFNHDGKVSKLELGLAVVVGGATFTVALLFGLALGQLACGG